MKINQPQSARAFTLIELLMVIAIIGIIAGLTLGGLKYVSRIKKDKAVGAMLEGLVAAIDSYHATYGAYPPDNGYIATTTNSDQVGIFAQTNLLFYELLSAPYNENNQQFHTGFDGGDINGTDTKNSLMLGGVRNSLAGEAKQFFKAAGTNFYRVYLPSVLGTTNFVMGMSVPVPLDPNSAGSANWWHYDASSIFRHNKQSYDLWAVYNDGGTLITNGNWKK